MKSVKRIFLRLALFSVPFLLLLVYPFLVMLLSGEFVTADRIIQIQSSGQRPYMVLQAYSDNWSYLKLQSAAESRAEVLALGTSRMMQFRDELFNTSFYNAAHGVADLVHYRQFLEQLPDDAVPQILIAGLDPEFFNPNWVWSSSEPMFRKPHAWKEWMRTFGKKWPDVYKDLFAGKIRMQAFLDREDRLRRIGLAARIENNGFMNDGSLLYGGLLKSQQQGRIEEWQNRFDQDLDDLRNGRNIYVPGSDLNMEALEELMRFLDEARRRGIYVIGLLGPYAPVIMEELEGRSEEYTYMDQLESTLRPYFKERGFDFFNFMDSRKLDASNEDFYDDIHDTGRVTLAMFQQMRLSSERLDQVAASHLERLRENRFWPLKRYQMETKSSGTGISSGAASSQNSRPWLLGHIAL